MLSVPLPIWPGKRIHERPFSSTLAMMPLSSNKVRSTQKNDGRSAQSMTASWTGIRSLRISPPAVTWDILQDHGNTGPIEPIRIRMATVISCRYGRRIRMDCSRTSSTLESVILMIREVIRYGLRPCIQGMGVIPGQAMDPFLTLNGNFWLLFVIVDRRLIFRPYPEKHGSTGRVKFQ